MLWRVLAYGFEVDHFLGHQLTLLAQWPSLPQGKQGLGGVPASVDPLTLSLWPCLGTLSVKAAANSGHHLFLILPSPFPLSLSFCLSTIPFLSVTSGPRGVKMEDVQGPDLQTDLPHLCSPSGGRYFYLKEAGQHVRIGHYKWMHAMKNLITVSTLQMNRPWKL